MNEELVVFGAGLDALHLVELAANLGWHTTVVDTRARASTLERFQKADAIVLCQPEDITSQVSLFERAIVVVMTHNYLHDLEILRQLLPMRLQYVGCSGPRRRTERLLTELAAKDSRFSRPTPETSWTGFTGYLGIDNMNPVNPA